MRARSPALQHQVADEIALHDHGIEHAIGIGHGRALGDQRRVHTLLHALLARHGDAQQLDLVAHVRGVTDVRA